MTLNIVMVEPQIPQNTGNVARTCAATGARLHLVGPMGFAIDDRKLKRAGLDYWHLLDITHYKNLAEFFAKTMGFEDGIAGGLADFGEDPAPDTSAFNFFYFTTKARRVYSSVEYPDGSYIFFGSETKGLSETLLRRNEPQCIRLPMKDEARSLNLSNTVAVGVYEVLRQWGYPDLKTVSDTLMR